MATSLSTRQRWQFAAVVGLLVCVYLFLAGKEFAASVFAARPELPQLERAVRLSPGNADYRHRLGRYFAFVSGDPQAAIASFRGAVALNPHDARYWFDLAAAYQVTGDISDQRTALDRALEAEPTAPDVAWEAANFFLIDGEIDRALREFQSALEMNPKSTRALVGIATAYLDLGQKDNALSALQQASALDPNNWIIHKQIWAIEHPEQFYPAINSKWQEEQLQQEKGKK